jgi:hypothetical protein
MASDSFFGGGSVAAGAGVVGNDSASPDHATPVNPNKNIKASKRIGRNPW